MLAMLLLSLMLLGVATPGVAQGLPADAASRPLPQGASVGIIYKSSLGRPGKPEEFEKTEQAAGAVQQALLRYGYQVHSRAEVVQRLVASAAECPGGAQECEAADVLQTLQLDAVVLVALWPEGLTIEVTTAKATGTAKGPVGDDDGSRAAVILKEAFDDLALGREVTVRVDGFPSGAEVRLDREVIGVVGSAMPVTARRKPGRHVVVLSKEGFATTEKQFEVPRGAADPFVISVKMEPAGSVAVTPDLLQPHDDGNARWDYIVGGSATALGALLMIAPAIAAMNDGECNGSPDERRCDSRYRFDWAEGLQLAAGLISLSAGIYVIVDTPIRASMTTDGDSAYVQLQTSF